MIIIISFSYIIAKAPASLKPILFITNANAIYYQYYLLITNMITWFSNGVNLFIYYHFNAEFKKAFLILFKITND